MVFNSSANTSPQFLFYSQYNIRIGPAKKSATSLHTFTSLLVNAPSDKLVEMGGLQSGARAEIICIATAPDASVSSD